ncbi:MAG: type II toxin-antitoxin system VapB family antitoxin [Gemmatimonadales bacterium]|jgi:Arc/MetJ family transcription regulator
MAHAARGTRRQPLRRRKTLDLDQRLLDEARAALGARTETDAVHDALERVVQNRRFADGLRALAGRRLVDRRRING